MKKKDGYWEQYESLKKRCPDREIISLKEACDLFGISRQTATNWIQDKQNPFPAKKIGKSYFIPLAKLASYLC